MAVKGDVRQNPPLSLDAAPARVKRDARQGEAALPDAGRRAFLRYVGYGVGAIAASGVMGPLMRNRLIAEVPQAANPAAGKAWADALGTPSWKPVSYPLPIPGDDGSAETDADRLASYEVKDDLVLPEGFRRDVVAQWGDRFDTGDGEFVFGYNADYTGLVPIAGTSDEFYLLVNHEYVSARPWLAGCRDVHGVMVTDDASLTTLAGQPLGEVERDLTDPTQRSDELGRGLCRICELGMGDLGVSIVHVRRLGDGRFVALKRSPRHFRIAGGSSINLAGSAADGSPAMQFTGPAATLLGMPRGTFSNCSGATTPWGTFLSCEENFQDQVQEFIDPSGRPLAGASRTFKGTAFGKNPVPFEFEGLGTGLTPPLDGRQYGWVVEVDPVGRTMTKHTTMGRFRHENVAVRADAGKPIACYMGDDRRGGHVWKFVSSRPCTTPRDPGNSLLLREGTLYVARFNADFTGRWIALAPDTPLRAPEVDHYASRHAWLPRRDGDNPGGHAAVGLEGARAFDMTVADWIKSVEAFSGKTFDQMTLGDLVRAADGIDAQAVLVTDAYAMANTVGGTPTARPEDIEVHPVDSSIYIAFTDSTGSGDGSPDVRIFPDSAGKNSRQYGAIYRLAEDGNDPAATTFTWGKFVASGEMADGGGGFACADNLVFDPQANLWMVCDITTPAHNFTVTRDEGDRTAPGMPGFVGVFGNNALFMIPTAGPRAGLPHCFAIGPMECEMTGPTFTDDGLTLIVAVQHPGETYGPRKNAAADTRPMRLATRDGTLFTQQRTVPLGSNFPSGKDGDVPRPCVVCITRA